MADLSILQNNKISEIYHYCSQELKTHEPWKGYYKRRYLEFNSYCELLPSFSGGKTLEIGCGNGYQSAFLSVIAEKVVSTDLPDENFETHTPGMNLAMDLLLKLKLDNVEFRSMSAEQIPFGNEEFDFVYASHVLEHIPDKRQALHEIYRVLKPGGIFLCIVPTSFEKFYAFVNFHLYLIRRALVHSGRFIFSRNKSDSVDATTGHKPLLTASMKKQFSDFPFPPPHGHSESFIQEFKEWTPRKWREYLKQNSPFVLLNQSTTQFNPLLPMFGSLMPFFAMGAHESTRKFERKHGHRNFFQKVGVNSVFVLVKPII